MDAPHRAAGQCCVGLRLEPLHPPFGLGIVVHLLDLDGGEPFEFYSSDGRYDVVFDHVLIGLCGVGADHRLAVGFQTTACTTPLPCSPRCGSSGCPGCPDGFRQLFLALGLRPGGHAFLDGPPVLGSMP